MDVLETIRGVQLQFTLEQHEFEPLGSICVQIFSVLSYAVLYEPWQVESVDEEPKTQKNLRNRRLTINYM